MTQFSKSIKLDLIRSNPKAIVETSLRRSGRVSHQSDRYYDFLIQNGDPIELDKNNENLIIYIDAMQRSDSAKWLEVIKSEMKFIKVNDIWTMTWRGKTHRM